MISKIGEWISRNLVNAGIIRADEKGLYDYGFFLLLSKMFFCIVTVFFGIVWNVLWSSILFFAQFVLIRGYAGGVHASKERDCILFTTLCLFISVAAIHLLLKSHEVTLAIGIMLISATLIFSLSPIESAEKPLSLSEYRRYKKLTHIIVLVAVILALGFAVVESYVFLFSTTIALAFEATLLLLGICVK